METNESIKLIICQDQSIAQITLLLELPMFYF